MSVFIIAEVGVNHNGSIELAKRLIDLAVEAKCDAVKFQAFNADKIAIKNAVKAQYQIDNTGNHESQVEMLKKLELSYEQNKELYDYCRARGIMFLSTPFDEDSADMLEHLGIELFKISSGDITNEPLLKHIAKKQIPIILSTGMSTLGEVEIALGWIYSMSNHNVSLLHCTSEYPADKTTVNLSSMLTLKSAFGVEIGYSDHTEGIEIPIAAVAIGAQIIEKHFTLDKSMEGPDHRASLEPKELVSMVECIRNIECAMGNGIKRPTAKEMYTREIVRKSIVTKRALKKGHILTYDDLCIKRPGSGLEPAMLKNVLNRAVLEDLDKDHIIRLSDLY